jgi:hypothetical protein
MKFFIYLIRWQISGLVMMPVLTIMNYGVITNVIIAQMIGAVIFYKLDEWILKDED